MMLLQFGEQQFGWLKGGFFVVGRTPFRPPFGRYQPADEIAFLQRYARHLDLEIEDVEARLAVISAPEPEGAPGPASGRPVREPVQV